MKRVVIAGLGLIGGSIGKSLREAMPSTELIGIDSVKVLQLTAVRELLNRSLSTEDLDREAIRRLDADLVVLAIPVGSIIATIGSWLDVGMPLTDCGSTKAAIVAAARACISRHCFVPGHPMAGRERGGFESATADLFRSRRWIVCPAGASATAISVVRQLVQTVGAVWTEMTPDDHDAAVAVTSHLPQLLASWLAAAIDDQQAEAAGPAFSDMTRIAGGAETMWKDIFSTNAAPLAAAARGLAADFTQLAADLENEPPTLDRVLRLLDRARQRSAR